MSSLRNKVQLIGYLGQNPETKNLENGSSVTRMSIATTETWVDKQGERKEDTQWHNVVCWGKSGETMAKFLKKGSQVAVEGKLNYGQYDKDGITRYTTDVVVSDFTFLDKKSA